MQFAPCARRPTEGSIRADEVGAHLKALDAIFSGALDIEQSPDAAARCLERPTPLLNGVSPLPAARRSLAEAERALKVIREAGEKLWKLEHRAQKVAAQRPKPTKDSVIRLSRESLGNTQGMAFLRQPHPLLKGQTPLALAEPSDEGAARVDRLLRQALAATAL